MKKTVPILYVIFANLLILAHAAVPHHHHSRLFTAAVSVLDCQTQSLFDHWHYNEEHHHLRTGSHEPVLVIGDWDWQLQSQLKTSANHACPNGQNAFADACAFASGQYPPRDLRLNAEHASSSVNRGFALNGALRRGPPLG